MRQSEAELGELGGGSWGKVYKMFGIGEMTQSNAKGNFQKNFLRRKKEKVGIRSRRRLSTI